MQLPLQTFTSLVQNMAAATQAAAAQLLELTVGSVLRAILEASASVALWMQWLILQVLQMTRAATSNGADLDSWMADFSVTRLPASPASGTVTFSRFTSSATALVPVGSLVRTIDGSQTFAVVAETSATGWSQAMNGYVIPVGCSSLNIPVLAQTSGTAGNVQAGTIGVLATALAGVDTVSNASAFINGLGPESDAAFRLRFQDFLSSRSRATLFAIEYAINTVQQGLSYTIQENCSASGAFQLGNFVIYVDDGSGFPSSLLLSMIQQAVDAVRPIGSTFSVFAPAVTQVNVSLTIAVVGGGDVTPFLPPIVTAISSYANSLPVGAPLPASRIVQIAYGTNPSIVNVTGVLLNGLPSDVLVQPSGVVKIGTVVVS